MARFGSMSKGRIVLLALVVIPIGLLCYQSYARNRRYISQSNGPVKSKAMGRAWKAPPKLHKAEVHHVDVPPAPKLNPNPGPVKQVEKKSLQAALEEQQKLDLKTKDMEDNARKAEEKEPAKDAVLPRENEAKKRLRNKLLAAVEDKLQRKMDANGGKKESQQSGPGAGSNEQQREAEDQQQREAEDQQLDTNRLKRKAGQVLRGGAQQPLGDAPNKQPVSVPTANQGKESQQQAKPASVEDTEKLNFVKKMIKHAWDSYERYAWGYNELSATSKSGSDSQGMFGNAHLGASLVDALDTLYIAGFMSEYEKGKKWVEAHLDYNIVHSDVSMFEMNIRFVGACLSMYALTGDEIYKTKAKDLVDRFMPAFRASGLAHNWIVLNGYNQQSDHSGPCFVVAEPGTLHLEFAYLSMITGDDKYLKQVEKTRDALTSSQMTGLPGVISAEINTDTGSPCRGELSLDGGSDSYYEYLIKSYLQSGKTDQRALRLFNDLAQSVDKHMLGTAIKPSGQKYRFLGRTQNGGGYLDTRMGHLACFSGGMFALGAQYATKPDMTMQMGKDITESCREMYHRSATKIGPDEGTFVNGKVNEGSEIFQASSPVYLLRPEVVESYFVLWRTTRDPKYREWAWEAAQAIEKHCRVDGGYTDLQDVMQEHPTPNSGMQQSFFLAETLKYLYLIFTDDDVLPLDKWVFNTEAHPFPVKGAFKQNYDVPVRSAPAKVAHAHQAATPKPEQRIGARNDVIKQAVAAGNVVGRAQGRLKQRLHDIENRQRQKNNSRQQQGEEDMPLRSRQENRNVARSDEGDQKANRRHGNAHSRRRSGVQMPEDGQRAQGRRD